MENSINTIKHHLANDELNDAIEILLDITKNTSYENEALVIKSKHQKIKKDIGFGRVERIDERIEIEEIRTSILSLADKLLLIDSQEFDHIPDYIVGIDFGDGESAVSIGTVGMKAKIEPITFENNVYTLPSIIARKRVGIKSEVIIGENAINHVKSIDELDLNFKWSPEERSQWDFRKSNIIGFIEKLYAGIAENQPVLKGKTRLFIGCPSGWGVPEREAYKAFLNTSQVLPEIEIVPESRAALLHFFEMSEFNTALLNKKVILIDIGSSTTDISLIENFEVSELKLDHPALGLRLADEKILETFFALHPEGKKIQKELEKDEVAYIKQLYYCRKAREIAQGRIVDRTLLKEWDEFHMDFLLKIGLEKVLSDITFWPEGITFIGLYQNLLQEIKAQVNINSIDYVILTGGGASIAQIRDFTAAFFNKSPIVDKSLRNISQGIAKYGVLHYNYFKFQLEVEQLIQNLDSNAYFQDNLRTFYADFLNEVALNSTDAIWKPIAYQWKKGDLRLAERGHLKTYAMELYGEWLLLPENAAKFDRISRNLSDFVNQSIHSDVVNLFKKYHFPLDRFDVSVSYNPLMLFDKNFSPAAVFFNDMVYEVEDIIFKAIDLTPSFIRDALPMQWLDWALDFEVRTKRIMGSAIETVIKEFKPKQVDQHIITYIKGSVRREFDSKSSVIQYLLSQRISDQKT